MVSFTSPPTQYDADKMAFTFTSGTDEGDVLVYDDSVALTNYFASADQATKDAIQIYSDGYAFQVKYTMPFASLSVTEVAGICIGGTATIKDNTTDTATTCFAVEWASGAIAAAVFNWTYGYATVNDMADATAYSTAITAVVSSYTGF